MAEKNAIKELRSALNATSNSGGFEPGFSSADLTARINSKIENATVKFSELYNMIPKESIPDVTYIWTVRTSSNTSGNASYTYSEGSTNTGTPAQGAKVQLTAVTKTLRHDWEVERYLKDHAFYDAVADEVNDAISTHIDELEKQIVTGTAASGYGKADSFLGLRQIVNSFVTIGDTTSVYGITRASGKTYLDAQVVDAATAALTIDHLKSAFTKMFRQKAQAGMIIVSPEKADEIDALLGSQQRYVGTINIAGGFVVNTYNGIPIVKSPYMDKAGESNTDTKVFVIARDNLILKQSWAISMQDADLGRIDSVGGFVKSSGVLVSKVLTKNVVIDDLAA